MKDEDLKETKHKYSKEERATRFNVFKTIINRLHIAGIHVRLERCVFVLGSVRVFVDTQACGVAQVWRLHLC